MKTEVVEGENEMKLGIEEIQDIVCQHFDATRDDLLSNRRSEKLIQAREFAMFMARKFTTESVPEIARAFNRTYTAIIHGVKRCEKRLNCEPCEDFSSILNKFGYCLDEIV